MGTLINPTGKILNYRIFWNNNFSFFFNRIFHKLYLQKIRSLSLLFKLLFNFMREWFESPRIRYRLSFNFTGHMNENLNCKIYILKIKAYDLAFWIKLMLSKKYRKHKVNVGKLHYLFFTFINVKNFCLLRYIRLYKFWSVNLIYALLKRMRIKIRSKRYKITKVKLKKILGRNHFLKIKGSLKLMQIKFAFRYKIFKNYFKLKFKLLLQYLKIYLKLFMYFIIHFFYYNLNILMPRFFFSNGITNLKVKFINDKNDIKNLVQNISDYFFLALRNKYRPRFLVKTLRIFIRRTPKILGAKLVLAGRFFLRGKATYLLSVLGNIGSIRKNKNYIHKFAERINQYGACSLKLMLFMRRKKKFIFKRKNLISASTFSFRYFNKKYVVHQQNKASRANL